MFVAAPRRGAWDPMDPSSPVVIWHIGRLHPANEAHKAPEFEICICEGDGVDGDPASEKNPLVAKPWEVYPYPKITALIREGRLVEVGQGQATADLAIDDDDLRSLDLDVRAIEALEERAVTGVGDLAEKLSRADDPVGWLLSLAYVGESRAEDILEQLQARGLR